MPGSADQLVTAEEVESCIDEFVSFEDPDGVVPEERRSNPKYVAARKSYEQKRKILLAAARRSRKTRAEFDDWFFSEAAGLQAAYDRVVAAALEDAQAAPESGVAAGRDADASDRADFPAAAQIGGGLRQRGVRSAEAMSSEERAALQQQAANEAIAYTMSSGLSGSRRAKQLSADQRAALETFSGDGFGIFAPGNPALAKVKAAARGEKPPADEAQMDDEAHKGHGVPVPEKALQEMMSSLMTSKNPQDHAILREFQAAQQPRWLRRVGPLARIIMIILAILVCFAFAQVAIVTTLKPRDSPASPGA